ncbi:hypothetical protein CQA62_01035 [Helicobacter cholecystus]|uniref:Uncharacterized protein n=1 Tax=Helicobacter cholecystus TaxID=45498 RepID=A0A3D8IXL7_9HELI|nr:hypothetical protein CQA62_01035 [Helicobacter cholecystus]
MINFLDIGIFRYNLNVKKCEKNIGGFSHRQHPKKRDLERVVSHFTLLYNFSSIFIKYLILRSHNENTNL